MGLAPIAIFCYNRPDHLSRTLQALSDNVLASDSEVIIFCDGVKAGASASDIENTDRVFETASAVKGFLKVEVVKAQTNLGLQRSVIKGINYVLERFEKIIVVEDDVITSPHFLQFMNNALDNYVNERKVLSIGSWNYYYKTDANFFNHMPDTIAWATWRNRWQLFEEDGKKLYDELNRKSLMHKFNLNGKFNFENMLRSQFEGKISSWAIRWTAVAVLNDTLTLYPKESLSQHIGFDAAATNSNQFDYNRDIQLASKDISGFEIPVKEDNDSVEAFLRIENVVKNSSDYLANQRVKIFSKIKNRILAFIPYRVKQLIKKIIKQDSNSSDKSGWFGNYPDWVSAQKDCVGYDNQNIFEKVKAATIAVKEGKAAFERDSVLFQKTECDEQLLKQFKAIISANSNSIGVLDFGGSLGSVYFQYRHFLNTANIQWCVVEQAHFVSYGKQYLSDNQLKFYYTPSDCLSEIPIQVILLSSVLSYMEDPFKILNELISLSLPYIIIDRNLFLPNEERITKQVVPESIYKASYPCRILNEQKIIDTLSEKYEKVKTLDPYPGVTVDLGDKKAYFKGFIFKMK